MTIDIGVLELLPEEAAGLLPCKPNVTCLLTHCTFLTCGGITCANANTEF
jgi:hypothetical protein